MIKDLPNPALQVSSKERGTQQGVLRKISPWRGLLWAEWYAHSRVLLIFLAAWLMAVWVLPFFAHPGWILILGPIYALLTGPMYGGGDILDGSEEFSFSLPPTRQERYLARLIVGGGTLLLITAMNLLALGLDLPQVLARLYVQTGIIQPLPILKPGLLYGLIVALPIASFSFAFTISSLTHSRMLIILAWFWGALISLALLQLGFWYEDLLWDQLNGFFACPLLLVSAAGSLIFGYKLFKRKEIGAPSLPITLPGYWWLWILLFVVGLGLALGLISSLATKFPEIIREGPAVEHPQIRSK